jgi:hypothetical protein
MPYPNNDERQKRGMPSEFDSLDETLRESFPTAQLTSWDKSIGGIPSRMDQSAPTDSMSPPPSTGGNPVIQKPQISTLPMTSQPGTLMTPPGASLLPTTIASTPAPSPSAGRSPLRIVGDIGRGVGSALGQVVAPWAMPFIPGTVQHQMFETGRERAKERFGTEQQAAKDISAQRQAVTGETQEKTREMPGEEQRAQGEFDIRNKAEQRAEQPTTTQETGSQGDVYDVSRNPMTGEETRKPAMVQMPSIGTPLEPGYAPSAPMPLKGKAQTVGTEKLFIDPTTGKHFYGVAEQGGGIKDIATNQVVNGATPYEKPAGEGNELQMWMKAHPDKTIDDYMKIQANLKPEFPRIQPVNDAKGNLVGYNEFTGTAGGVKVQFTPMSAIAGMPQDLGGTPGVIPPKPTGAVLTQSQRSEMIQPQVEALKSQVEKTSSSLGPLSGRWSEVMTGKVGADNPEVARLQMQLKLFGTALMLAHGLRGESYEKGLEEYLRLAQSPDNLRARIEGADAYLQDYAKSTGHGPATGGGNAAPGGGPALGSDDHFNEWLKNRKK